MIPKAEKPWEGYLLQHPPGICKMCGENECQIRTSLRCGGWEYDCVPEFLDKMALLFCDSCKEKHAQWWNQFPETSWHHHVGPDHFSGWELTFSDLVDNVHEMLSMYDEDDRDSLRDILFVLAFKVAEYQIESNVKLWNERFVELDGSTV